MDDLEDLTDHFEVMGYRRATEAYVKATLLGEMYRPAKNPKHHWLYFTFLGFHRLRGVLDDLELSRPTTFCDIGTSSGLDAIGAWESLHPQKMILTDILSKVLEPARQNVLKNCRDAREEDIEIFAGDLAEPLKEHGRRVQCVYANLPTLPRRKTQEEINQDGDSAASFYPYRRLTEQQPDSVKKNLLELYYTLLTQLRDYKCLEDPGVVLCPIGGRRLWNPIENLFVTCQFAPTMLVFDIKPQEQADRCLPVYAEHEKEHETEGLRFHFLPYDEAKQLWDSEAKNRGGEEMLGENPKKLREFHDALLPKLSAMSFSATEALKRHEKNETVGHIVYVVMGQLRS